MFKIINTLVFSVITTVALSANVQAQTFTLTENGNTFTFTKTTDDRAADVKAAAQRYAKDRKEYGTDMIGLVKADTGGILHTPASGKFGNRKNEQVELDAYVRRTFKNEVIFNTERAAEESLRSAGMAYDMRASKIPTNFWAKTDKTAKDLEALYGAPAYTVQLGTGTCMGDYPDFSQANWDGDRTMMTYVDLDKEGNLVEIHVGTCVYTEGPYKGTAFLRSISPPMKNVNFIERYAKQERRVLNSTIGSSNRQ